MRSVYLSQLEVLCSGLTDKTPEIFENRRLVEERNPTQNLWVLGCAMLNPTYEKDLSVNQAMKQLITEKLELFGSVNKAVEGYSQNK